MQWIVYWYLFSNRKLWHNSGRTSFFNFFRKYVTLPFRAYFVGLRNEGPMLLLASTYRIGHQPQAIKLIMFWSVSSTLTNWKCLHLTSLLRKIFAPGFGPQGFSKISIKCFLYILLGWSEFTILLSYLWITLKDRETIFVLSLQNKFRGIIYT